MKIYGQEKTPVEGTKHHEEGWVENLHPELNLTGQGFSSSPVENCSGDDDDHAAVDEDEAFIDLHRNSYLHG